MAEVTASPGPGSWPMCGLGGRRNKAWPGLTWSLEFVHGEVRHPEELTYIRAHGIQTHTFHSVLASLCNDPALTHKGGAGTDIAEMLAYYVKHNATAV